MIKKIATIALCLIAVNSWGADFYSFPVAIPKNSRPLPSTLYLKLNSERINLTYKKFKATTSSKVDKAFIKQMDAFINRDFAEFKRQISLREGLKTDSELKSYLKILTNAYKTYSNLKIIEKVTLKNSYIYVWSVDVNGRKISTNHVMVKVNGSLKYKDYESVSALENLIKRSVSNAYFMPKKYTKLKNYSTEYEIALEDEALENNGAYLQFDGYFDSVEREQAGFIRKADESQSQDENIINFYNKVGKYLQNKDIDSALKNLTKKSVKRVSGNKKIDDLDRYTFFLDNQLMMKNIVFVLDANPFYMVFGTNFRDRYRNIARVPDVNERNKLLKQLPYKFNYLIKQDGDLRFTKVLHTTFLDTVLRQDDFFGRKILAPIISNQLLKVERAK